MWNCSKWELPVYCKIINFLTLLCSWTYVDISGSIWLLQVHIVGNFCLFLGKFFLACCGPIFRFHIYRDYPVLVTFFLCFNYRVFPALTTSFFLFWLYHFQVSWTFFPCFIHRVFPAFPKFFVVVFQRAGKSLL